MYRENGFHVKVMRDYFHDYPKGSLDWHWHKELEFAVVLSGKVNFYVNDTCLSLHNGEGIFVNSNCMHRGHTGEEGGMPLLFMVSLPPESLAWEGSYLYENYVLPVIEDKDMAAFALRPDCEWHKRILAKLNSIYALSEHPGFAYELQLQTLLMDIWYQILLQRDQTREEAAAALEQEKSEQRVKDMLEFIHENYATDLSIQEIADSAGISKSECFRCFQNVVHKKPITYVNEYRIAKAMQLLEDTKLSVGEICHLCGFHHESYFGKWFRKAVNMTPLQYRKKRDLHFKG